MQHIQSIKIKKGIRNGIEYYIIPALIFKSEQGKEKQIPHPTGSGIMEFETLESALEAIKISGFSYILPDNETPIALKQTEKKYSNIDEMIKEELLNVLKNSNTQAKANAIYALGEMRNIEFLPIFIEKMGEDNETIRNNSIEAILNLEESVVQEVLQALEDENWVRRMSAITLIEKLVSEKSISASIFLKPLLKRFSDSNNIVKCSAIATIGKIWREYTKNSH